MTGKRAGDCYCLLNQTMKFKAYYRGQLIKYMLQKLSILQQKIHKFCVKFSSMNPFDFKMIINIYYYTDKKYCVLGWIGPILN